MVSEDNIEFLKEGGRRYILGTPKSQLRRYEKELLSDDWETIREGLEVKLCPAPMPLAASGRDGNETFILCRSAQRKEKEKAIHQRFEERLEKGLLALQASCKKRKQDAKLVSRRVGRLLQANTRASRLFKVDVTEREGASGGGCDVVWSKVDEWRTWSELSEGCYLLRSNVTDWSARDLFAAYVQLTQAELAFRIQKDDLRLRPVWHQTTERVAAHILVCFLAYVLWKSLGQLCKRAGLGDDPRKVLEELSEIVTVDVVMKTRCGTTLRKRCVSRPSDAQQVLLSKLGLHLPDTLKSVEM
jgi:transposase